MTCTNPGAGFVTTGETSSPLRLDLHFKSEFFLRDITERHNDHRGQYLGDGRIKVTVLHKQLHTHIVQQQAYPYQYKVPYQLHSPAQVGVREYNVFVEQEAGGETHHKRHDQRGD